MSEPKKVTVFCTQRGGLQLSVHKAHPNPTMGGVMVPVGTEVLKQGSNQVDAAFMDAWREENRDSDLVRSGVLSIAEPKEKAEGDGKPGEDNVTERPDKESSLGAPPEETADDSETKAAE